MTYESELNGKLRALYEIEDAIRPQIIQLEELLAKRPRPRCECIAEHLALEGRQHGKA